MLGTSQRRDLFLHTLEQMRRRYRFVVLGYVVMPEHFHLLLSEPQRASLSTVMQALKLGLVRRVSAPGPVWQPRFYDFNLWSEHKRIQKLRYMHRNPVKRGLVDSPEQWSWSSFRFYLSGESGIVRINDADILQMRVPPRAA